MKCAACNYQHFKTEGDIIEGDEQFKTIMVAGEIVLKSCPKCKTVRTE